jgi:hypothetical protein
MTKARFATINILSDTQISNFSDRSTLKNRAGRNKGVTTNDNKNDSKNPGYFVIRFNCNQREKPVQRLNLLFANESKSHFRRRLRAALKLREETKAAVRLEHLLDTLTATAHAHSKQVGPALWLGFT